MADIATIKRNVAKLVSMGAPEEDIDQYIAEEGSTIEAVRSASIPRQFSTIKEAQAAQKQAAVEQKKAEFGASPLGFAIQHPFLAPLQGGPEFLTGRTMEDRAREFNNSTRMGQVKTAPFDRNLRYVGDAAFNSTVGAGIIDAVTSPSNLLLNPATKLASKVINPIAKTTAKAFSPLGETLRKLPTRLSDAKSAQFADKVRSAYVNTKRFAVDKFGKGLESLSNNNPTKKIDLFNNQTIQDIATDPNLPTEAKNVFGKTPILRDILSGKRTSEISIKEAQDIANYLQNKIPQSIKSQHLDIAEMINEVKLAQSTAFPKEMAKLRSEYARIAQPYKDIKGQMRFNNLLQSIDKGFGGSEAKVALRELFKDSPELLKEMGGYKNAGRLLKGLKWTAGIATAGLGGKQVIDAVSQK